MRVNTTIQVTLEVDISGEIIPRDPSIGDMREFAEDIEVSIIKCDSSSKNIEQYFKDYIIREYREEIQEALCEPDLRTREIEKDG